MEKCEPGKAQQEWILEGYNATVPLAAAVQSLVNHTVVFHRHGAERVREEKKRVNIVNTV